MDPRKFAEKKQQPVSIGNRKSLSPRILLQSSTVRTPSLTYEYDTDGLRCPFPSDINVFLYYTTSPGRPRISGELRLRVTSSKDPSSFASGSDLCLANGLTWSRPLHIIPKYYNPLYQKLREDKLVPDDLDAALSILSKPRITYARSHLIYSLNDTFIIDFRQQKLHLSVVTEQGLETLALDFLSTDRRARWGNATPYRGSVSARFERSSIPEHKDTRTVVLRFLKIITPVQCVLPLYDGYIAQPMEGRLFLFNPEDPNLWSFNIDDKVVATQRKTWQRAFRLLWDV